MYIFLLKELACTIIILWRNIIQRTVGFTLLPLLWYLTIYFSKKTCVVIEYHEGLDYQVIFYNLIQSITTFLKTIIHCSHSKNYILINVLSISYSYKDTISIQITRWQATKNIIGSSVSSHTPQKKIKTDS